MRQSEMPWAAPAQKECFWIQLTDRQYNSSDSEHDQLAVWERGKKCGLTVFCRIALVVALVSVQLCAVM
jgi:hypothetical protein